MKTGEIDVSILMITYNQEKYIGQAIESILRQKTDYRYELCIADDASSDRTAEIVAMYAEKHPEYIRAFLRSKNLGATKNSYCLAQTARGRYIAFCEGDDYWENDDRIDRQIGFLDSHPEYAAICGRSRVVDAQDNERTICNSDNFLQYYGRTFTWKDYEDWNMPGHISALLGRNVFRKGRGCILYKAHTIVGDRTTALLFLQKGDIYCTLDVESCYRYVEHQENYMSRYRRENLRYEDYRMMQRQEQYIAACGQRLNLSRIKKERYITAIVTAMKKPSRRNRQVVWKIWRYSGRQIEYLYILLKVMVIKITDWKVLHRDRRITLRR